MDDNDVQRLVAHIHATLGDPATWSTPRGYPDGLALCIIDSIQSLGVRYQQVETVVRRYREYRQAGDAGADTDDARELLDTFDHVGGHEAWAATIGNRQRAWARKNAPLKAQVIYQAAQTLTAHQVTTAAQLRDGASSTTPRNNAIEPSWRALPGQRSGVSWRYLLMLAQVPGVKPDRMIRRFVTDALRGKRYDDSDLVGVVVAGATHLHVDPSTLDHRIWLYQSGRLR